MQRYEKHLLIASVILLCALVFVGIDAARNRRIALENYFEAALQPAAAHIKRDYESRSEQLIELGLFLRSQSAVVSLATIPGIGSDAISRYCRETAEAANMGLVAIVTTQGTVLGSYGSGRTDWKAPYWQEVLSGDQARVLGPLVNAEGAAQSVVGVPIGENRPKAWLILGKPLPISQWHDWARASGFDFYFMDKAHQVLFRTPGLQLSHDQYAFFSNNRHVQWLAAAGEYYAGVGLTTQDQTASVLVLQAYSAGVREQPWVNRLLVALIFLGFMVLCVCYLLIRRTKPEPGVVQDANREMIRSLMAIPVPAEEALQVLQEGLVRTDSRMVIRWANRAFAEMVGVSPDVLKGQSLVPYCPFCEAMVTSWAESNLRFLSSEPKQTELIVGGEPKPVSIRTVLKRESFENDPSFYFVFSSIEGARKVRHLESENNMLRAQLQAVKDTPPESPGIDKREPVAPRVEASTWLRAAVHRVKNPLGVLVQGLDYLQKSADMKQAQTEDILQLMRESVSQADNVMRGLLQFEQLEKQQRRRQSVVELVNRACTKVQPLAAERGVAVHFKKDPVLPEIEVDGALIAEAAHILMEQSLLRSAPGSEVTVSLEVETPRERGQGVGQRKKDVFDIGDRVLVLTVLDYGPPIDEAEQEQLLKPFAMQTETSGAGLALVNSIADVHRGAFQVRAGRRAATLFRLLLPAEEVLSLGKAKLLLIDDDRGLCKLLKLNLEKEGEFQVEVAYTGAAGLNLASNAPFDIVLTDYQLPDTDGKAVLRQLKERFPEMPVVLFSIFHDHAMLRQDPELQSADAFLAKPIDHVRLRETLLRLLKHA